MKIQSFKSTSDIVAFLTNTLGTTPSLRSFTSTLLSADFGALRIDVVGVGMDINTTTQLWNGGQITEVRMFQAGAPLTTYTALDHTVARGSSLGAPLTAAIDNYAGNDELIGSDFRDDYAMGAGNDTIRTGAGNDLLRGQGGNDIVDGGAGLDVAILSGASSNYSLVLDATRTGGTLRDLRTGSPDGTDTLTLVEYLQFTDGALSLPLFGVGAQSAPDAIGTQVYRFAKTDNGQYFYSGSAAERDLIIANLPTFRYEGAVYNAQDNWVTGYNPVYRFANLSNGGYFYTASADERDLVFSNYPSFRYEGATFFVPAAAGPETIPVYRLANTTTGGYLFTTSQAERTFAVSLGVWRDEGVAFPAPRTVALAFSDPLSVADSLAPHETSQASEAPLAADAPLAGDVGALGADWLI